MKYNYLLIFLIFAYSSVFSQSYSERIDSIYQLVDKSDIETTADNYVVINNLLNKMEHDAAVRKCKELIGLTIKKQSHFEHYMARQILAVLYLNKDKEKAMLEYINLIKNIPALHAEEQAYAYYFAGKFYIQLGMQALGANYYFKSLSLFKFLNKPVGLRRIYMDIGGMYYRAKLYNDAVIAIKNAVYYYKKIEESKLSDKDKMFYISNLNTIALSYHKMNNHDSAMVYYEFAYKNAVEYKHEFWQTLIKSNMGKIFLSRGMYDTAIVVFRDDITFSKQINETESALNAMISLAEVYLQTNELDSAYAVLERCRQYASSKGEPLESAYFKIKSKVSEKGGDYHTALKMLEQYNYLNDSINRSVKTNELNKAKISFDLQLKHKELEISEIKNEYSQTRINRQNYVIFSFIMLSFILIVLLIFYLLSLKKLKKAHKQLKETQMLIISKEKMVSLGTLTAGVSHEINNPLNYINLSQEQLKKYFQKHGSKEEKETTFLINSINEGVNRISSIVKGLNQFGRDVSMFDETCNVHSILNDCLIMLNNKLEGKIAVKKEYFNGTLQLKGSISKLYQVFINILSNSIQAIEENGIIELATDKNDKYVSIKISDNGRGIRKKDLKHILDPFFTTNLTGRAVGLGLSISYSIIKEHKGSMDVESELGKGTSVTVEIPNL